MIALSFGNIIVNMFAYVYFVGRKAAKIDDNSKTIERHELDISQHGRDIAWIKGRMEARHRI